MSLKGAAMKSDNERAHYNFGELILQQAQDERNRVVGQSCYECSRSAVYLAINKPLVAI